MANSIVQNSALAPRHTLGAKLVGRSLFELEKAETVFEDSIENNPLLFVKMHLFRLTAPFNRRKAPLQVTPPPNLAPISEVQRTPRKAEQRFSSFPLPRPLVVALW